MMNKKIILTSRPAGELNFNNFEIVTGEIPIPEKGQVLLNEKYFSEQKIKTEEQTNTEKH